MSSLPIPWFNLWNPTKMTEMTQHFQVVRCWDLGLFQYCGPHKKIYWKCLLFCHVSTVPPSGETDHRATWDFKTSTQQSGGTEAWFPGKAGWRTQHQQGWRYVGNVRFCSFKNAQKCFLWRKLEVVLVCCCNLRHQCDININFIMMLADPFSFKHFSFVFMFFNVFFLFVWLPHKITPANNGG